MSNSPSPAAPIFAAYRQQRHQQLSHNQEEAKILDCLEHDFRMNAVWNSLLEREKNSPTLERNISHLLEKIPDYKAAAERVKDAGFHLSRLQKRRSDLLAAVELLKDFYAEDEGHQDQEPWPSVTKYNHQVIPSDLFLSQAAIDIKNTFETSLGHIEAITPTSQKPDPVIAFCVNLAILCDFLFGSPANPKPNYRFVSTVANVIFETSPDNQITDDDVKKALKSEAKRLAARKLATTP